MIQTPQQGRQSHVNHGELIAEQVFVFNEHGRQLRETITQFLAGLVLGLCGRLISVLKYENMAKELTLKIKQEQPRACTHGGVGRHELWMRKALINVFIDNVGFVQNEVALL